MMRSPQHAELLYQDDVSIARQAEAYLGALPDVAGNKVQTVLADGMVLVSSLLRNDTENAPAQESNRKLASLVLAKMQRITRDTSLHGTQGRYPCFTS